MSSLEKCLFRSSTQFVDWVVSFFILSRMSYLYILENNPVSDALLANIFFYSVGCLFVLFMVSFEVQKLLSLVRSHLFTFVTMSLVLRHGLACKDGKGNGTPLQYSCLENPVDGGAWQSAIHEVAKSRIRLSDFPFTFHFHALEKEMATHSSVLAWRIPGTGEPGELTSMGSHRVGHN